MHCEFNIVCSSHLCGASVLSLPCDCAYLQQSVVWSESVVITQQLCVSAAVSCVERVGCHYPATVRICSSLLCGASGLSLPCDCAYLQQSVVWSECVVSTLRLCVCAALSCVERVCCHYPATVRAKIQSVLLSVLKFW